MNIHPQSRVLASGQPEKGDRIISSTPICMGDQLIPVMQRRPERTPLHQAGGEGIPGKPEESAQIPGAPNLDKRPSEPQESAKIHNPLPSGKTPMRTPGRIVDGVYKNESMIPDPPSSGYETPEEHACPAYRPPPHPERWNYPQDRARSAPPRYGIPGVRSIAHGQHEQPRIYQPTGPPDPIASLVEELKYMRLDQSIIMERMMEKRPDEGNKRGNPNFLKNMYREFEKFSGPTAERSTLQFVTEYRSFLFHNRADAREAYDGLDRVLGGKPLNTYLQHKATVGGNVEDILSKLLTKYDTLPVSQQLLDYKSRRMTEGNYEEHSLAMLMMLARSQESEDGKKDFFVRSLTPGLMTSVMGDRPRTLDEAVESAERHRIAEDRFLSTKKQINEINTSIMAIQQPTGEKKKTVQFRRQVKTSPGTSPGGSRDSSVDSKTSTHSSQDGDGNREGNKYPYKPTRDVSKERYDKRNGNSNQKSYPPKGQNDGKNNPNRNYNNQGGYRQSRPYDRNNQEGYSQSRPYDKNMGMVTHHMGYMLPVQPGEAPYYLNLWPSPSAPFPSTPHPAAAQLPATHDRKRTPSPGGNRSGSPHSGKEIQKN